MLSNNTGHMVGEFEKLGQFYNDCLEFKEKPVNFTPGKSISEIIRAMASISRTIRDTVTGKCGQSRCEIL